MTTEHEHEYVARGPRVAIRPITPADEQEWIRLVHASTELHHPWMYLPNTPVDYADFMDRIKSKETESYLICDAAGGEIVGFVNLNSIILRAFRSATLGYAAFVPYAGRGYMTEGIGLVTRYALSPQGLDLHRLEINVQPGNEASINIAKRNGYRLEGFSPDYLFIGGAWRDHERWAITTEMLAEQAK
ncbi:GNAT family N-acetyltransferase [Streptomyces sp. A7024]|uniref:GNAT family N-acetyltransferase n=1 Tax=Streptomyces coryli TaxID=1128680 RepID=A0A6G4TZS0_9ACTN|nr:GNAT family protein [Streptomyces coryli]NGN65394.1 GNAT family N-acetyltransferase [Streptomyces coryli]